MNAAAILSKAQELAEARRAENLQQYAQLWLQPAEIEYLDQIRARGGLTRTAFIRSLIREIIADDKAAEGK